MSRQKIIDAQHTTSNESLDIAEQNMKSYLPPVESFIKDYMVNKEDICKILEKGMNYRDYNSLDDHYSFKMNKDGSINGIDTAD